METLVLKVPEGTKARLKAAGPSVSAAAREAFDLYLSQRHQFSAHERAKDLCGADRGTLSVATGKDYLKQYAPRPD